ncbi:CDP-alcohol phosphatidyltransferase family protein [Pelagibius litoralis]|uniref:CDP-alcohol phosphatidyltransferase family protein n=1 Tax=Pelagibius litoralis TaxID=374515 RepID=A0A967F1L8_9PROT|nr:CDP-alcohol phosphatidyltransferase family protein [Pelagibius litoralis]NIA71493.1 CDP-alcohol phosphatidyltransferase family protein [Pelagibius litoralis]
MPKTACLIGHGDLVIWFEGSAERLRRSFAAVGITQFIDEQALPDQRGPVILVRADAVIDGPLVKALLEAPGSVLLANGPHQGTPLAAHATSDFPAAAAVLREEPGVAMPTGLQPVRAAELGASYWKALRKREEPYALLPSPHDLAQTEWRMFMGTYKGATDFVTKWLWPRPAFYVTRLCARLGITPNQITALSLVSVIAAFYWFWQGSWWLGLLAGWLMTFLDTVDGKLARITLRSSKFGNFFDHSIDLIHPPFWYLAWGIGLQQGPLALAPDDLAIVLTVIVGGYLLQRVIEGISIWRFRLEIHIWRRVDTWFRLVTARRNPNLVLLTLATVAGWPDVGLAAVAVWTAVCLLLHGLQLVQAWWATRNGQKLRSWMTEPD